MSSFQDWVPLLKQRSHPSRELLLEEETMRHGEEAEEGSAGYEDVTMPPSPGRGEPKPSHDHFFSVGDLSAPLMHRDVPAASNPIAFSRPWSEEVSQHQHHPSISFRDAPDRGPGYYASARHMFHRPSLLQTGRHAGRSRVKITGVRRNALSYHFWKRDFFTSCINVRLPIAVLIMVFAYTLSFLGWACAWYALYRWDSTCITGFESRYGGFVSAFLFATETQQTIGYGFRAPNDCWTSAWMVVFQSVWGQLLDAVTLGVIFARISHPKQRARTIFISDSAVIARRDGVLKFMFRIGDVRSSQVVSPSVRAIMYTWGPGRHTAEGEFMPVRIESLQVSYPVDLMLLLPVTIEHTIDERSPLYGHTHESLTALGAEIVVAVDATTEHGDQFMTTRSYLPSEMHWGCTFVNVISRAKAPSTHHSIDIGRFHDVEPQREQGIAQPHAASKKVTTHPQGIVPYPALHENTLVVSDQAVVAPHGDSLALMFRVGDVYPNNMIEVHVRAYLYRWRDGWNMSDDDMAYELHELDLGYNEGRDRLMLRLPVIVRHIITPDSPLASWRAGPAGLSADADAEIYVAIEGVQYRTSNNVLRRRTYTVNTDVRWMHQFKPIVTRATQTSHHGKPRVRWSNFHTVLPVGGGQREGSDRGESRLSQTGARLQGGEGQNIAHALSALRAIDNASAAEGGSSSKPGSSSGQALEEDEELSTRTMASPPGSWKQKRSLFNLFRRQSEDDEGGGAGPVLSFPRPARSTTGGSHAHAYTTLPPHASQVHDDEEEQDARGRAIFSRRTM